MDPIVDDILMHYASRGALGATPGVLARTLINTAETSWPVWKNLRRLANLKRKLLRS